MADQPSQGQHKKIYTTPLYSPLYTTIIEGSFASKIELQIYMLETFSHPTECSNIVSPASTSDWLVRLASSYM